MHVKLTKGYKVKSHYYILNQLPFPKELKAHQVRTTQPLNTEFSTCQSEITIHSLGMTPQNLENHLSLITTFSSYASSMWKDHFESMVCCTRPK